MSGGTACRGHMGLLGVVRGYKVNLKLMPWNDASTCWCKEKSSTVRCGEGPIFGVAVSPPYLRDERATDSRALACG